jgi:CDP-diacylglycerol pyrophosphatase
LRPLQVLLLTMLLAGAGLLAASIAPARADPNALWTKVVQVCVKSDPQQDKSNPCDIVDKVADYVLVKDICGPTQYLLMPVHRLSGIESADLATAPNYFRDAWENRDRVAGRAGRKLAPQDIALALNSIDRRSQNQFHIHLDLARAGLGDALRAHQNDPAGTWSLFRFAGLDYHLMRLTDLASQNPVALVRARLAAENDAAAQGEMRHQSIGLTGATFADGSTGFYLLNTAFDGTPNGSGWAEGLEIDHPRADCGYRRVQ